MSGLFYHHLILIAVFFVLFLLSFFFSVTETSIISLSKIRLRHMVSKGIKRAMSIQRLVAKLDELIAAILIGNSFVNIAISAIVTALVVNVWGYQWGILISTVVSAFLILIFCEITPKILALKYNEKISLLIAPFMELFIAMFHPVVIFFTSISNFILRVCGVKPSKRSPLITEEELRLMIEVGKEEGVVSDEERKMLHRIFEFGDIKISDVMVQKDKMVAININSTPESVLDTFVEEGHARLPVYKDTLENIVGIIYARDLLYILRDKGLFLLPDIVHTAYYVPQSLKVHDLLKKFQADKIQIAIVVDEQKKALGLVTLEDLIEEIVGEIEEEHAGHLSH